MSPEQEQVIISKIQNGELPLFTDIYDHYIKQIYGFIFNRIRHKETTEDLTSVVFFKALNHIGTYKGGGAPFAAWLYTIARNTIIDHYRKAKPQDPIEDFWDLASDINIENDAEKNIQLAQLQKRMQTLTPRQREVVTMRVWDNLSHKEIASVLGISESNSKVVFSRAVSQLGETGIVALILLSLTQ